MNTKLIVATLAAAPVIFLGANQASAFSCGSCGFPNTGTCPSNGCSGNINTNINWNSLTSKMSNVNKTVIKMVGSGSVPAMPSTSSSSSASAAAAAAAGGASAAASGASSASSRGGSSSSSASSAAAAAAAGGAGAGAGAGTSAGAGSASSSAAAAASAGKASGSVSTGAGTAAGASAGGVKVATIYRPTSSGTLPKAGPEGALGAVASLGMSGIGYAILRVKKAAAFIKANL